MSKKKIIIMCGGGGQRLWPLSNSSFPKQFLNLIDDKSLLSNTIERFDGFDEFIFLTNERYRFIINNLIQKNLNIIDKSSILLEPETKNTAPAICLSLFMENNHDDDVLVISPSDHYIKDASKFNNIIHSATEISKDTESIVTLGIKPIKPSSQFGYIEFESATGSKKFYNVKRFHEKPNEEKAKEYLNLGNFFWNSGVFIGTVKTFKKNYLSFASDIYECCSSSMNEIKKDGIFIRPNSDRFSNVKSISIDYAVIEKMKNIKVLPLDTSWSDIGNWNSLHEVLNKDDKNNSDLKNTTFIDSENNFLFAKKNIYALGVKNIALIESNDKILIADKKKLDNIKDYLPLLSTDNIEEENKNFRPWGWYETLILQKSYQVKKIVLYKDQSISLQLHHHRSEHWVVTKGIALVTNNDKEYELNKGESTFIPKKTKHRLKNIGQDELEIIEVQIGDYLGEDDIVRFDDKYGRS